MTPENFVTRWKWGELTKASSKNVENLKISKQSKDFLVLAGLPRRSEGGHLHFDLEVETFPAILNLEKTELFDEMLTELKKIGMQSTSYICISEKDEKLVVVRTKISVIDFLNSSLLQMAECLLVSGELVQMFMDEKLYYENDKDRKFASEWLEKKIQAIDKMALASPRNIWSVVINEI